MHATRSEIKFEVHHVFISKKLKKLKEEESLLFGPSCAANFLQLYLLLHPPWFQNIIFLPQYCHLEYFYHLRSKSKTLAQCLASYLGDLGKFFMYFPLLFQAGTGKKLCGKNTEQFIPLLLGFSPPNSRGSLSPV